MPPLGDIVGPYADASSIPIVMAVPPVDHDLGAIAVRPIPVLVPVPVSLAHLHSNALDFDIGALSDDYWFVNNHRGTGKCRYGEEWNSTHDKNSFLHGTSPCWDV